jgi:RND family efflux transporter MFP subunit
MNRWSLTGVLVAMAALLSLYGVARGEVSATRPGARDVPVPIKVITAYIDTEVPEFPGRVDAGNSALLAFRVAGQLSELKVRMGERVEMGAVLAELDPTDFQLNLDARQAEYDLARLEAERASTLYQQELISEDQYDISQTALATSRASLEQAREQLSFCKLTAPFGGAIAFTYAMPSENVTPQQAIVNLQDTSSLEIQFNLPPRFHSLLKGDDRANFSVMFELMPGIYLDARYKEENMQPDPDTNSYPVTLQVAAPDDFSARPGMPVSVRLHHHSLAQDRWIPPVEAMFGREGNSAQVWRIDPTTMTVHQAELVLDADGVLLSGLQPGDQIVAAGVDRLEEGQRVRPWLREGGL